MSEPALEVLKGTLDVLILKSLSWGPLHGYAVSRWIRQLTEEALQIEEGALYPALHRLERRGFVDAEWGLSENNRRARYYRLTPAGADHLREETESWTRFSTAVGRVLNAVDRPALVVRTARADAGHV
jgi:transcriptional regulator